MLTNSLIRAGKGTIPKQLLHLKGPKWNASPEVEILLTSCRNIYKQWQDVGKPKAHPVVAALILEKRKLHGKLRIEQALSRQNLLINRNRSNQQTSTNCLKIEGECNFVPEYKRRSFAAYYEDLSISKEDIYDNSYHNLCKIRHQLFEQAFDKGIKDPEQFTETEVLNAIEELSPIMSSLLISEARCENKKAYENVFTSVLGVQSAFDVEEPPDEETAQHTDIEPDDDQLVQPRRSTRERRVDSGDNDMTKSAQRLPISY
ncbi:unnamed protein product [Mytilus coruscus]|uniref:Uncharacterized protein n=1 Tax=Mytilus coruscus TaxID=42192 RepID=A0A6J8ES72_MYTCO|nr:unnamed protein product [Mytilus coruscus]